MKTDDRLGNCKSSSSGSVSLTRHLELAQRVISRMASNSFLLKGWSVTLVAAILAFAAEGSRPTAAVVVLLPAFAFWGLDAYYLRQERLFRRLYEALARGEAIDLVPFSLSTKKYHPEVQGWFRTLWAPTVAILHGLVTIAAVTAIIALYVHG